MRPVLVALLVGLVPIISTPAQAADTAVCTVFIAFDEDDLSAARAELEALAAASI